MNTNHLKRFLWVSTIAMAAALLVVASTPSVADAGRITGYVTVYNDASVSITFYLDGRNMGTIQPGHRSSWYVGDSSSTDTSHTLEAFGTNFSRSDVVNGVYANYTWRVY